MGSAKVKVVVAMSGGVDSSVAALLLKEQGYDVVGLFMRHGAGSHGATEPQGDSHGATEPRSHEGAVESDGRVVSASASRARQGCCSASDAADARFVAGMLGTPFYALNFEDEFDSLIDYFADEYAAGRTPNPCVVCNSKLKFGRVVEYADAVGARYIATGHYARVENRGGRNTLLRAVDSQKDQSYVLFGLNRGILDRVLFPIGHLNKSEVREIARRNAFPNCDKPDSVEICFVPDRNYARVVRERRPEAFIEGEVLDAAGSVVGRHNGLANYTIGQRRGLGIALGQPAYVTQINVASNTVTLGGADGLLNAELVAERVNYIGDAPDGPLRADVKIRYLHTAAPALVVPLGGGRVRVEFDSPQRAITPGQAVVFYEGDAVIGGGWIAEGKACPAG